MCSTALARAEVEAEQRVQRMRQELITAQERCLSEAQQHQAREAEWRVTEARLHEQFRGELEARVRGFAKLCPAVVGV
jgi:hypothetical protein